MIRNAGTDCMKILDFGQRAENVQVGNGDPGRFFKSSSHPLKGSPIRFPSLVGTEQGRPRLIFGLLPIAPRRTMGTAGSSVVQRAFTSKRLSIPRAEKTGRPIARLPAPKSAVSDQAGHRSRSSVSVRGASNGRADCPGMRNGRGPCQVLFFWISVSGDKFLGGAVCPHGAIVMVALQPNFSCWQSAGLGRFHPGEMVVKSRIGSSFAYP